MPVDIQETLKTLAGAVDQLQKRVTRLEERLKDPVQTSVSQNAGVPNYGPWPWHEKDYK